MRIYVVRFWDEVRDTIGHGENLERAASSAPSYYVGHNDRRGGLAGSTTLPEEIR